MNSTLRIFLSIAFTLSAVSTYAQAASVVCRNSEISDTTLTIAADRESGVIEKGGMPNVQVTWFDHQSQDGQDTLWQFRGEAGANVGAEHYKVALHFNELGKATHAVVKYHGMIMDNLPCEELQQAN